jgi:acetyl-CoA acetyltransferase
MFNVENACPTGPGGKLPVNTSGGLVSKGHPAGAENGGGRKFEEIGCRLSLFAHAPIMSGLSLRSSV